MSLVKKIQEYKPDVVSEDWLMAKSRMVAGIEAAKTAEARQWLEHHGIHKPGMSRQERFAASKAYRNSVAKKPPIYATEPHLWAYQVMEAVRDGECLSHRAVSMAQEVIEMDKKIYGGQA